jgi:hypothetical protein
MTGGADAAAAGAGAVRDLAIARIAEPEEITRLVLFVASGEASFSTGDEFIADGGQLLGLAGLPSETGTARPAAFDPARTARTGRGGLAGALRRRKIQGQSFAALRHHVRSVA